MLHIQMFALGDRYDVTSLVSESTTQFFKEWVAMHEPTLGDPSTEIELFERVGVQKIIRTAYDQTGPTSRDL